MYRFKLTCVIIFLTFHSYCQKDIDYNHKWIYKGIEKFLGMEQSKINQISIPDSIIEENYIQGKYFTVANKNNVSQINYMYIGRVYSCRTGGCSISMDLNENFETEYFDYFILFDPECTVQLVRVFNYAATHGHEVSAIGWLKQFAGYNGTDILEVGKNVDAISGATISVYAITKDVKEKTAILRKMPSRF